jgi:hypothetical protein
VGDNPYQSPLTEPPPGGARRKLASLGVKILSVPIGLLAFYFAAAAVTSVVVITFPGSPDRILGTAIGIGVIVGIAAGVGAGAYCFRIANAIQPKTMPNQDSN